MCFVCEVYLIMERKSYIDSVKGICILWVVAIHAGGVQMYSILGKIAENGRMAVQIFFVISSFLAFNSFSKVSYNTDSYFKISIKWILCKFINLFPIYLASLVAYSFWYNFNYRNGFSTGSIKLWDYALHLFMLNGLIPFSSNSIIGVEWYIGVLFIFYLFVPIMFKKIKNLNTALRFLVVSCFFSFIINNVVYRFIPQIEFSGYFSNNSFWIQLPVLVCGIVFFFLLKDNFKFNKNDYIPLLILTGYLIFGLFYNYSGSFTVSKIVLVSFFSVIILYILEKEKVYLLDNHFFAIFGKYSYPIYLFHYLILYFLWKYFSFNVYFNIIFASFISLCLALCLQHISNYITKHLLRRLNNV